MNEQFSVIIPAWNYEKYITKCLDSVFSQDCDFDYEIIVCLNPSIDNTEKIVKSYQKDHMNLKIINCNGKGVAICRLLGIKEAKGKYIAFLDADDYYHPSYLSTMFKEIEKGYDIVNCSFFNDRDGKISKNSFVKNTELDSSKACKALLNDTYMRSFLWSKVFKRELFDFSKLILPKVKKPIFEDTMMLYEIFTRANKVKSIKTPLYYYRNNSSSLTKKENKDRFFYHLYTFLLIKYISQNKKDPKFVKAVRSTIFRDKLSLMYDAYSSRHALGHGIIKEFKNYKTELKLLKSKEKLNLDKLKGKDFILESLQPLDI